MQNTGRKLGGMERLFYQQNMIGSCNMISVLLYEGSIDLDAVPDALKRLHKAFPSLTSRIVSDTHLRFVPHEGTIPFRVMEREDDEHFRRLARTEVRRQFDKERILFTFLIGEGKGEIILSVDHVLMDAKSLYAICQYFIAAMHGREFAFVPMGEPWEKRMPKEFRGLRGLQRTYRFIKQLFRESPERSMIFGKDVPHVNTVSYGFQMDRSILKDLKVNTDRHGTNLNAIFSAAAILTAHEIYANREAGTVCLNTPVSVRDQMTPKASADEMGMFLGAFLQWHPIDASTDIWKLSRAIFDRIKSGLRDGDPLLLGQLAKGPKRAELPKPDKHRERFTQSITVSNPGRLESFEDLPNAKIVGYRNLGSLWQQESITVVVLGYGDKLCVDAEVSVERLGHFPDAAKNLAEGIRRRILEAVQPQA